MKIHSIMFPNANHTPREPEPIEVKAFWSHMLGLYQSQVVDKKSSSKMKLAGWFLEKMGILDRQSFLENFTTTIGRSIYIPYKIGEEKNGFSLWAQASICVHEHQHIEQLDREGYVAFSCQYLFSSSKRAAYEAEAYLCNIELHFWRYGKLLDPYLLAAKLKHYGCSKKDIAVTQAFLEEASDKVCQGEVITRASQQAIAWMNAHVPDWRNALG